MLYYGSLFSHFYRMDAQSTKKYTFGFDIGTTSCGWAVVDTVAGDDTFVDMGTRIFPEPRDPKGVTINTDRRTAR